MEPIVFCVQLLVSDGYFPVLEMKKALFRLHVLGLLPGINSRLNSLVGTCGILSCGNIPYVSHPTPERKTAGFGECDS
jgi:hypothetical protein